MARSHITEGTSVRKTAGILPLALVLYVGAFLTLALSHKVPEADLGERAFTYCGMDHQGQYLHPSCEEALSLLFLPAYAAARECDAGFVHLSSAFQRIKPSRS